MSASSEAGAFASASEAGEAGEAGDAARVGGKAAALAFLASRGFPTPPFFVLCEEAFDAEDRLTAPAREELEARLAALGPAPYAVRSSAPGEDCAARSQAGQYASLLDVEGPGVEEAARAVRRSGNGEGAARYRARLGAEAARPRVLVQRMAAARIAGMAFSADPVSGRRDRIVISAVRGLADRLTSGEVSGQSWTLDRRSGEAIVAPDEPPILAPEELCALAELTRSIEAAMGEPQDVEWAYEGDRLYVLQARPITTALRAEPIEDDAMAVFDNSNVVENYPGVVAPLTYGFVRFGYGRALCALLARIGVDAETIERRRPSFEKLIARLDGRLYYDLIECYRILALLPGYRLNREHMELMMGLGAPLPAEIADRLAPEPARGLARAREWARLLRLGATLAWRVVTLPRAERRFLARVDAALARPAREIDGLPASALAAEFRAIEAELLDRWDAPLINELACMIAFGASRALAARWAGPRGVELCDALAIGGGDIVSAEPARRIEAMAERVKGDSEAIERLERGDRAVIDADPELRRAFEAYLDRFGDRCFEELELESVPLDEDPSPLLASIGARARASSAGGGEARAPESGPEDAFDALFAGRPLRRLLARAVIRYAEARVRDRENLRYERTRIFGRARRVFGAMGVQLWAWGALDDPRDVFMLELDELLGAIEGHCADADLRALARLRSAAMEEAAKRPDPPGRIVFRGPAFAWARAVAPEPEPDDRSTGSARRGVGCSPGVVEGIARVVADPRAQRVGAGEILVARRTDPGWIALLAHAAAIVVERGSLLSHSAIVAREMGAPCVVGLEGATLWIEDGARIRVDGRSGEVTKLDVEP